MDKMRITEPGLAVPIPGDEIDLTVKHINARVEYSKRELSSKRDGWKKIFAAYKAEGEFLAPFGVKQPESRIHTPTMPTQIDRLVQQLTYKMVQPYENFLEVSLRQTKVRAYKIENFLYDMFQRNEFAPEIVKAVQSAALYGMGITKVIPNPSVPYPDCIVQHVPNKDFHPDPHATSIQNCAFIVEEMEITYDALVENFKRGAYNMHGEFQRLLNDCSMRKGFSGERLLVSALLSPEVMGGDIGAPSAGELRRVFSGLHYINTSETMDLGEDKFDRFTLSEYHDKNFRLTIVNGRYLIKARKVSMKYPYQAWYLRLDPEGGMFPKSHGELILPLNEEIDVKRNQRVENINKVNDPPIMYTPNSITKIADFVIKSGAKIPVNMLDGIKVVEIKNDTDVLFQEGQALKGEVGEITGVQGVVTGSAAKGERMTKIETQGIYAQASMPFDFSSAIMIITGMIPMFQCIMATCTVLGVVPGMGVDSASGMGEPTPITPMEFASDYAVTISINPNKATKDKQEALEYLQILAQFPTINQVALLRWLVPRLAPDAPKDLISEMPTGDIPPGTPPPTGGVSPG